MIGDIRNVIWSYVISVDDDWLRDETRCFFVISDNTICCFLFKRTVGFDYCNFSVDPFDKNKRNQYHINKKHVTFTNSKSHDWFALMTSLMNMTMIQQPLTDACHNVTPLVRYANTSFMLTQCQKCPRRNVKTTCII